MNQLVRLLGAAYRYGHEPEAGTAPESLNHSRPRGTAVNRRTELKLPEELTCSRRRASLALAWLGLALAANSACAQSGAARLFDGHTDIGAVGKRGAEFYDPAHGAYLVSGGGANMWFTNDAFHFVWTRTTGSVAIAAAIAWPEPGGNAHRKACLVIRQTLDADSPYVDAALHGNGLTSLQFRDRPGGETREIQSNVSSPSRLRLEKRGDVVAMSVARPGGGLVPAGGSFKLRFAAPFYIGLAVCAHDNAVIEQAVFSGVELDRLPAPTGGKTGLESTLEIVDIGSKDRRVLQVVRDRIEAPNWSRDGQSLLFNQRGRLYRMPIAGGRAVALDTGFALRCNNDHGLSPDGSWLAISDQSQQRDSLIYVLPATGGTPRRLTALGPSYWHGWSPDGRTLVFCGERQGEFDIYRIPVEGGQETRLTSAPGLDDGPDYSPDGRYIYFNSERTGTMQIWRMKPDGSGQEQVTADEFNNWFPHPSPDGKWLVFLSYAKAVEGHPENQDVTLRLRPLNGGPVQELARLFGGQGTINVPSWAPDSRRLAFVSYRLIYP
ncbi:MAG: PD40 domain-containing protein [Verrucomicrobia bacterium]|nr:PD40 domain-containing protein [Verrucomicrobiota bacterium]